ncbi:mCG2024, isoform CRA_b, partial [Mus musculus]
CLLNLYLAEMDMLVSSDWPGMCCVAQDVIKLKTHMPQHPK